MAHVLDLPVTGQDTALLAGLQARMAALTGLDGPGVTVSSSSQVWADPTLTTSPGYLNAVATGYRAGVERVPLQSDPAQAAQQINQAISAATDGHIPQLVSPGMLQGIGWVLTSALYLNADWATPFQASRTEQQPFTTAAGQSVTAPFMNGDGFDVDTADGWTGVTLPYQGGKLTMVALLPPAGAADGCAVPAATAVTAITGHGTRGILALPKVTLSSDGSMNELLSSLGMSVAFGDSADFSGLSPQACCIGFVQQAATLQVGEKGTVGSAAAAVGISASSAQAGGGIPVVFNRPYLLLVTSTATGEPLFLARVANPVAG
jgi:serpin B